MSFFMNILVIKTGALGDVIRTSFVAQALKEKYRKKNPKIFWLTSKKAINLFKNNPYVYSIIEKEEKDKFKKIKFDIVINLEEDLEIVKFASSLNYKKIIGFVYNNGKIIPTPTAKEWYDMSLLGKKPENDLLKKKNKKTHRQIISEIIGIKNYEKYEPFLRLNLKQRKIVKDFLRIHNLSKKELIIGINTGSADRWPKSLSIKKTAELINKLYRKFNSKFILFGGPDESNRNLEILKLTKAPVISAGCGNNLIEFPALISTCNLFICTDSLGLHISLALKRKTIALIGPTSPSEIDLYELGYKIISKSKCICCYKKNCKSMEKIDLNEILNSVKKLLYEKVTILITAYKEPNISKAIESVLRQKTNFPYELIVSAPDDETQEIVKSYIRKNKKIKLFKDPGKGKSFALNMVFSKIKTDILILTDGDVYLEENAVEEILNEFLDPEVGCVSGRPFPQEDKKNKFGYWAHFLFESAHKVRKKSLESNSFIECTGYLFAFRKNRIKEIPLDVAEDTVIPYILWQKGYKISYSERALVYIKNADNLRDWVKQKIRTHKSHGKLDIYVDTQTTPKVKSFKTEFKGIFWLFKFPLNLNEFLWSAELGILRFYTWFKYFLDTKIFEKNYTDAWERIQSTK